jgi:biopolymer transport protein ExbD
MRLRRKARTTDVDISPLIDMVFILLIFFMVSTTFVKDAKVDLQRPTAQSAQTASSKSLRVSVDRGGGIYLDGAPVKSWMLQSKLRDAFRDGADKTVLVVSDGRVQVDRLVEVVDQARLAGAAEVAVATDREWGGG